MPASAEGLIAARRVFAVPFLPGDGSGAVLLQIRYVSAGGQLTGPDEWGTCPYCHGDPCAESSGPGTLIGAYMARNSWAPSCPLCNGRPT